MKLANFPVKKSIFLLGIIVGAVGYHFGNMGWNWMFSSGGNPGDQIVSSQNTGEVRRQIIVPDNLSPNELYRINQGDWLELRHSVHPDHKTQVMNLPHGHLLLIGKGNKTNSAFVPDYAYDGRADQFRKIIPRNQGLNQSGVQIQPRVQPQVSGETPTVVEGGVIQPKSD